MTKWSQFRLLHRAGHLTHPILMENSIIGDKAVLMTAQNPAKSLSTERILTIEFAGFDSQILNAI